MAITKDFVTDYGADNTGVASVTTKLYNNLRTDMQGQDVNLTFPAGSYNIATFGGNGGNWIDGAKDINITATGATLFGNGGVFLSAPHVAQKGIDETVGIPVGFTTDGGKNARVQTVYPGATSVTLTAASAAAGHVSRFSVGQCCLVTGWPVQSGFQGAYGYPPNWHFVEHVTITSIVGNTISFTPALRNYFSEQWPEMNRGTTFETDGAGPATLVGLAPGWKGTTNIVGGTYTNSQLINCGRENWIITGGNSTSLPIYPTVNKVWRAINHTATSALVEHDKLNDLVDVQGGTYSQWHCQSSSTRLLQLTGVTINSSLNGTVLNTVVDGCSIGTDIVIGPTAYGRADTFVCRNTSIGASVGGGNQEKGPRDEGVQGYMGFNMVNGLMTIPMCMGDSATRTLMPDASGRNVLFWTGPYGPFGSFKVLSCTADNQWPAADDQTATVNVTISNGSRNLSVSSAIFSSADVGKIINVPGLIYNGNFADCTITNASPGVVTQNAHGKVANDPVRFQAGSGVLPSGITANTVYYVVSPTTNTFQVSATVGGAAINTSGGSGTVRVSYSIGLTTFIKSFTDSQNVVLFDVSTEATVTSVSRSLRWGTCNMYVQTDQAGGLPTSNLWGSGGTNLGVQVPPARSVTFENCTGTGDAAQQASIADLCQPAAQGRPLRSYSKRTYDGSFGFNGPQLSLVGNIVSIKVNVTKAYTGVQSTLFHRFSGFDNLQVVQNNAYVNYTGRFNLKAVGERVITLGNVTGQQTGDSNIGFSTPTWLCGSSSGTITNQINVSAATIGAEDPSVLPSYTIEIITDQGFPTVPAAVAPLRLRLRA